MIIENNQPIMTNGLVQITSAQIQQRTLSQKLFGLDKLQNYLFQFCKTILLADKKEVNTLNLYDLTPSILLYGIPNTGKTTLCYQLFERLKKDVTNEINFYYLDVGRMLSPELGQSSRNLEEIFSNLQGKCQNGSSSFLVLDELDTFCMSRSRMQEHDAIRRAMTTLMLELDKLCFSESRNLIVVGITNVVELIDTAVVRRFSIKEQVKGELSLQEFQVYLNLLSSPLGLLINHEDNNKLFEIYKNRKFTPGDIKCLFKLIYIDFRCQNMSEESVVSRIFELFETGFSTYEHLSKNYQESRN